VPHLSLVFLDDIFLGEVQRLADKVVGITLKARVLGQDLFQGFFERGFVHFNVLLAHLTLPAGARCDRLSRPSRSKTNPEQCKAPVVPVWSSDTSANCIKSPTANAMRLSKALFTSFFGALVTFLIGFPLHPG
jgi:hypothetical protein